MLKLANYDILIGEIPDEITLGLNISNCPYRCPGCHSNYLWNDTGDELSSKLLDKLISDNKGITCVVFMGGDQDSSALINLINQVNISGLKSGLYTGGDESMPYWKTFIQILDFIKIGPYISEKGGLESPGTNQKFYFIDHSNNYPKLVNWNHKFIKH